MIVDEPPPKPPLTTPEHPKLALASTRARLRLVLMVFCLVVGGGILWFLKTQSLREQQEFNQAKAAEVASKIDAARAIRQAIITQYKGASANAEQQALVGRVGHLIAQKSDAKTPITFYLMAEENAINLYALPTGEVFVTTALVNRMKTEGQLAAALAHGAAHVIAGDLPTAIGEPTTRWYYSIEAEAATDTRALTLMEQAGYDPNAMIGMFTVLADAYAAGADVAFFTTHPNSEDRLTRIQATITATHPDGVPNILSK